MIKQITLLVLFISTIGFSQETINKDLGSFDELKVFNGLHISLEKSTNPSITISGKKADEVVFKNVNGKLKLSLRFPETFNSNEVDIVLKHTDKLVVIDANEGSRITSENKINTDHLELRSQEGALIEFEIKTDYLNVKAVTGGQIILVGKATYQDIEVMMGGTYKGYEVESNHTSVISASGAVALVNAKVLLDAKVRFGGTVFYKGKPKDLKTKKIIGGTIKSVD
jgi:hypothetical protein